LSTKPPIIASNEGDTSRGTLLEGAGPSTDASDSSTPCSESKSESSLSVDELTGQLLDEDRPLFERYRAMFALRNRGGAAAVGALCRGMLEGASALFRHECAYVLGQMAAPEAAE